MTQAISRRPCNNHDFVEGRSPLIGPSQLTEFEEITLNIPRHLWAASETLVKWVLRNKDKRYVPEDFLNDLGMTVNADFSGC